jgi:hypothetical protein
VIGWKIGPGDGGTGEFMERNGSTGCQLKRSDAAERYSLMEARERSLEEEGKRSVCKWNKDQ